MRHDAAARHEPSRQGWIGGWIEDEELRERSRGVINPLEPVACPEPDARFHDVILMSDDSASDDFPASASNPLTRD